MLVSVVQSSMTVSLSYSHHTFVLINQSCLSDLLSPCQRVRLNETVSSVQGKRKKRKRDNKPDSKPEGKGPFLPDHLYLFFSSQTGIRKKLSKLKARPLFYLQSSNTTCDTAPLLF